MYSYAAACVSRSRRRIPGLHRAKLHTAELASFTSLRNETFLLVNASLSPHLIRFGATYVIQRHATTVRSRSASPSSHAWAGDPEQACGVFVWRVGEVAGEFTGDSRTSVEVLEDLSKIHPGEQ